jgi:hypothetical protein
MAYRMSIHCFVTVVNICIVTTLFLPGHPAEHYTYYLFQNRATALMMEAASTSETSINFY